MNRAGLQYGRAIYGAAAGNADRPDMVWSQYRRGRTEERQLLSVVYKRDIAGGVIDGRNVARTRGIANVNEGLDIVKADLRRLRQYGERRCV